MTDDRASSNEGMKEPLISICIPTYNRADVIGRTIKSVLLQSYQNFELLIIDNASTDNTDEVLSRFHDDRIQFIKNAENLGLFGNYNRCLELATGSLIHILHSDDTIDPDFIQTCINFLNHHPDIMLTFSSAVIYKDGIEIGRIHYSDHDTIFTAPEGFRQLLLRRSLIPCPSVITRREVFNAVGKFCLELPYASDYYQWLRIAKIFNIAYISGIHVNYYQSNTSESYRLLYTTPIGYFDNLKIFVKLINELGSERKKFQTEMNCAISRFIGDSLYAGFMRSDMMKEYSFSFFTGLALSALALISPLSVFHWMRKMGVLFLIFGAGILGNISIVKKIARKYLFIEGKGY